MSVAHAEAIETIKILITDRIAQEGITLLREELPEAHIDVRPGIKPDQLKAIIGEYHALIVRSETQVTGALLADATHLKIVGRAGVGVDNIDTEAATRQGIMVVNSPTGNIVAAAEHTIAMLMALARQIPAASSSTKAGKWEKSRFLGVEVRNKVLGIIGLGKVGTEVARRAQGLEMLVIAFDPYVAPEQARKLGVTMLSFEEVLKQADFVTLHTSLTSGPNGTKGLISTQELLLLKPAARLINCARGGLIDEEALLNALNENRLAGVALDVFSQEPVRDSTVLKQLLAHERVIATPHLGASTEEAQIGVATDVAEQIISVLRGNFPRSAVNAPLILPETLQVLQPYMRLVEQMGHLYTQLQPGPLNKIEFSCSGDIANYDLRPLQAALIKGLLESISDAHVNMINAPSLAKQWGLEIIEQKSNIPAEFANLITLRVVNANGYPSSFAGKPGSGDEHVEALSGTVMHGEPRIVRVGRYWAEFVPEGYILFCRNLDKPGMIGRVGTVLGKAGVNIRHMDVGPIVRTPHQRDPQQPPDTALMIVSVDDPIPEWALQEIGAAGDIFGLTVVKL
ncbi:MAG TPA: phosphoglycerate dehydrogenase [Ktedonobacter sp.]|jgi:D-3-phosphoglycerate dehydrogenase|nr:phosphoglycerate dehydrogenase [Ktedonobacter sp.]HAT45565.1 phosphoglycerate dehydrogenase [Ktedonobacter sp.]HBE26743.1 phosphoglycerate dehydrogenase [Ktedonobacter sp.]HBE28450.1 phosphoglycerate dehydrogenase [Ktedonobacter sp.]HCF85758.1 phosphoglycerate dehydrogenase [Ktedonobacter sp.]